MCARGVRLKYKLYFYKKKHVQRIGGEKEGEERDE